jgi:hypothetical protein
MQNYNNGYWMSNRMMRQLDISTVPTSHFMQRVMKVKLKVHSITLYNINKALEIKDIQEKSIENMIPNRYHNILPVFGKVVAQTLTLH